MENKVYSPTSDPAAKTTKLAQEVQYVSGSWIGAVVRTSVAAGSGVSLSNVNLVVPYRDSANLFGDANGIFGFAYEPLNNADLMSGDNSRIQSYHRVTESPVSAISKPYTIHVAHAN